MSRDEGLGTQRKGISVWEKRRRDCPSSPSAQKCVGGLTLSKWPQLPGAVSGRSAPEMCIHLFLFETSAAKSGLLMIQCHTMDYNFFSSSFSDLSIWMRSWNAVWNLKTRRNFQKWENENCATGNEICLHTSFRYQMENIWRWYSHQPKKVRTAVQTHWDNQDVFQENMKSQQISNSKQGRR